MKLISRILILILVCLMLLTSCGTDDKNADNKATATVEVTEAPTATATTEPTASSSPTESLPTTESTQKPVTEPSENPATTEEPTVTTKPTKNPIIIVQPTEKPTEKPTSTTKPTVVPTNKPTATVKSTVAPTTPPTETSKPTLDPSVDYSQWGKHGFDSLLPIPLPFSDVEADWISRKTSTHGYEVTNNKKINLNNPGDIVNIVQEYVTSCKSYGYIVIRDQSVFTAILEKEKKIAINCGNGYLAIMITDFSQIS